MESAMLWMIAQREFLDHFRSARCIIGLVLAVSITLGVVAIATEDYEQRLKDCSAAPKALDVGWNRPKVFHRPSPLSVLAAGDEVRLGNRVDISHHFVPVRPVSYSFQAGQDPFEEGQVPFSETGMWSMDFVFVVKVILSLMVLFLMYDTVAGENERGTLPLVLSGSLGRAAFLTGKLLGGLISTFVMFAMCALLATLVMVQSPAVQLDYEGTVRLLGIFGVGYLCLAAYCAVGLLISSAFKRTAPALLVAILVWVVAVGLLPGLGVELARYILPLPSQAEVADRLRAARESVQEELQKVREEGHRAFAQGERTPREIRLRRHDLTVESAHLMWQVNRDYLNRMSRQRSAALVPVSLSPSAALDVVAGALAGTDAVAIGHFMRGTREFAGDFGRFMRLQIADPSNWSRDQMPAFHEQFESVPDAFGRVIGYLAAPLALFVLCFLAAQVVFSRYEVRRE